MNKSQFIERVAEVSGQSKALSGEMVDAVFGAITQSLKEGEQVNIVGFGNFLVKHRAARMGRNPKTGEPAPIAAGNQVGFKAGKSLKDAVNNK